MLVGQWSPVVLSLLWTSCFGVNGGGELYGRGGALLAIGGLNNFPMLWLAADVCKFMFCEKMSAGKFAICCCIP